MANSLNFNTLKKRFFTVILADENKTTLQIGIPTKKLIRELRDSFSELATVDVNEDDLDSIFTDIYKVVAKVMSNNKAGIKITAEHLEECLEYEHLLEFFKVYMEFVNDLSDSKN